MEARPVWKRHLRRTLQNVNPLPPPTEEEVQDALEVLKESRGELNDTLDIEAFRIFEEVSIPSYRADRQEALDELTRLGEEFPGGYR